MRIGVISDTHGLLRPEALAALEGVAHILHAGDVGKPGILEALEEIAPVTAIRGNVDTAPWAAALPDTVTVKLDGRRFHMLHDVKELTAPPPGADAVIFGHSHKPGAEAREGVLYLNPGSAGPRRFRLPVTLAVVETGPEGLHHEILPLLD